MAHELQVEGDKVIEKDAQGHVLKEKDYSRVHAGYAAAAHNKKLSAENRENAEQMMHDLEAAHGDLPADDEETTASGSPKQTKSASASGSHAGGGGKHHHKETKEDDVEHAKMVHEHRVAGGLKATLHRDDRSEEAKEHARERLEEMGIDPDTV